MLKPWHVHGNAVPSKGRVAYLLVADNVSGPLLTRLIDPSQPVIHTGNEFSRPRLALLASI
jgi:hypothetical protein